MWFGVVWLLQSVTQCDLEYAPQQPLLPGWMTIWVLSGKNLVTHARVANLPYQSQQLKKKSYSIKFFN